MDEYVVGKYMVKEIEQNEPVKLSEPVSFSVVANPLQEGLLVERGNVGAKRR